MLFVLQSGAGPGAGVTTPMLFVLQSGAVPGASVTMPMLFVLQSRAGPGASALEIRDDLPAGKHPRMRHHLSSPQHQ